ncbi:cell filamentation protein Fic [Flavobacterium faecale]|uniref:Cell filamentation protein Fic n=1 Tax=Flavobacterium faecale TaxID=1355330 RepID=A0A2S1LDJ1_9FLAO|nr:Fic family protein [Flavobacterium faecale]AWG21825.1 cell filamentation protein Fic [Flavobacterium faecale]
MTKYIHERPDFPQFYWDNEQLLTPLSEVRFLQGRILGKMESLGFSTQYESNLLLLETEVLSSGEIEGEIYKPAAVRSSIAKQIGDPFYDNQPTNQNIDGFVALLLDAFQNYKDELTTERIFSWHAALFPMGNSGLYPITVGGWRQDKRGPMQVVSGGIGNENIHFEAPAATLVPTLMEDFMKWLAEDTGQDLVIKAAVAHLWFLTIHPFDDGNGRIARSISESLLAKSENCAMRCYSLSSQILSTVKSYYDLLEATQKGNLDCTNWLLWFIDILKKAIIHSETVISRSLQKAEFWKTHQKTILNDRQLKMIQLLWNDFEGNLTTKKWAKITKCSDDTALRDINDLIFKDILYKEDKGSRSTSYKMRGF